MIEELKGVLSELKKVRKLKYKGYEVEEWVRVDLWELEYLQRDELKNQLLLKIQSKIL